MTVVCSSGVLFGGRAYSGRVCRALVCGYVCRGFGYVCARRLSAILILFVKQYKDKDRADKKAENSKH